MKKEAVRYNYKTVPYAHQICGTVRSIYSDFFALFMEQGTGKTKTIIDTVNQFYAEKEIDAVLLIAPNGVHKQWENEQLPEHSFIEYIPFVWTGSRGKKYTKDMENFIEQKRDKIKWFFVNIED